MGWYGTAQARRASPLWESNPRHQPYHGCALPTELRGRGCQGCCKPVEDSPVFCMFRASLRSCLRMPVGPTLALPGPTCLACPRLAFPVSASLHVPGVAALLPPHARRPDAGAFPGRRRVSSACSGVASLLPPHAVSARRWRFPGRPASASRVGVAALRTSACRVGPTPAPPRAPQAHASRDPGAIRAQGFVIGLPN